MLIYEIDGPYQDGTCLVGYRRPHRMEFVPVCDCNTVGQAQAEADRLNREQMAAAHAVNADRPRRVAHGFYDDARMM